MWGCRQPTDKVDTASRVGPAGHQQAVIQGRFVSHRPRATGQGTLREHTLDGHIKRCVVFTHACLTRIHREFLAYIVITCILRHYACIHHYFCAYIIISHAYIAISSHPSWFLAYILIRSRTSLQSWLPFAYICISATLHCYCCRVISACIQM